MAVTKDQLNKLIQQLPEDALPAAAEFLEKLIQKSDPRFIPWDDEPTAQEDLDDMKKAKEAFKRGETIKLRDVIDDLLN